MAAGARANQLIVIVGPTASGKSEAAMRVALKHGGEIICADSRTVYKGLDIGTAKPSQADRQIVPHHVLDVVQPDEAFSAAKFQRLANKAIDDIKARGKLPMLVGGTGLFVDSVLFNYGFGPPADPERRAQLEAMNIGELHNYCKENNIELPSNTHNKRHLVRVIEQQGVNQKRNRLMRQDAYVVGIAPGREILQKRIQQRAEVLFASGVVDEATNAAKTFGWDAPGLNGNIYPIIRRLVEGELSRPEAIAHFAKADWQLARRQMTWFRRNKSIQWCESPQEAEQLIDKHLAHTS